MTMCLLYTLNLAAGAHVCMYSFDLALVLSIY